MIFGVCFDSLHVHPVLFPSSNSSAVERLSFWSHRGIFHILELTDSDGILNERLFIQWNPSRYPYTALTINPTVGLDGAMVVLSIAVHNIFRPGRLMVGDTGFMKLASQSVIEMCPKDM